ncbi:hypothetical protein J2801_003577 [Paraburkholderia phenoliruptrix]|uniref:DUF2280 domain-containing protein n=1 Tax=Paraburkholderia phenoliruptrix TaxID=252970 RepID=UPI002858617A|nr:DUF2280 domain-containing protein [Paraburkholderia phenoliruptrix]MDR6421289.1 hypothetical protein [Paraburkholderia phenoliruptrix]
MAALTDDVKAFVVQALACFDTPTQVANAVKEEFGLEITRMQVSTYDPTKFMGRNLSKKWREIFEATRKAFLEDQASIPIANQNFRLRALNNLYQNAATRGNAALAAQLLEQAAKESGGSFTNRREMTGRDGAPLIPTKSAQEMTDDELAAYIGASGARAMDTPQG